ncbi:copper oxidase [Leptospira selangorensis]|uniref:Copper oxidase n=1 Tax=Leptospira selangorensis TaxID=2484982 RepID=A0A5F2C5C0_9LEPT|nr:multicopper oxidase domain-containing protein [Leptospira selangorensis]TGM14090.1 copper oxidase [Leptospira selangorensis]TGM26978.1 copper oxidase [Leptospira selangorensis]
MNRKDFLRWLGIGGAGLAAGTGIAGITSGKKEDPLCRTGSSVPGQISSTPNPSIRLPGSIGGNSYGSMVHPPMFVDAAFLSRMELNATIPQAPPGSKFRSEVNIIEMPLTVAHNTVVDAWTFDGVVPGKVIRARLGQEMELLFRNHSNHPHSVHFHGTHDPGQDGWEPIAPGAERIYKITAGPIGFHPYHCHVPPLASHMSKGLYGGFIVDPAGGRPPALEFMLILAGWDLNETGRNDIYAWNGIAGYYDRFPIKVPVGKKVRLYIANMTEHDPVASFHLHSQTFDVYRTGTKLVPDEHTDVITLGQTERAIVEFTLTKRGRYMFHPHQTHMADRGAMGWIVAV